MGQTGNGLPNVGQGRFKNWRKLWPLLPLLLLPLALLAILVDIADTPFILAGKPAEGPGEAAEVSGANGSGGHEMATGGSGSAPPITVAWSSASDVDSRDPGAAPASVLTMQLDGPPGSLGPRSGGEDGLALIGDADFTLAGSGGARPDWSRWGSGGGGSGSSGPTTTLIDASAVDGSSTVSLLSPCIFCGSGPSGSPGLPGFGPPGTLPGSGPGGGGGSPRSGPGGSPGSGPGNSPGSGPGGSPGSAPTGSPWSGPGEYPGSGPGGGPGSNPPAPGPLVLPFGPDEPPGSPWNSPPGGNPNPGWLEEPHDTARVPNPGTLVLVVSALMGTLAVSARRVRPRSAR